MLIHKSFGFPNIFLKGGGLKTPKTPTGSAPELANNNTLSITYVIFIFSAGGLAIFIHTDYFRSRIPKEIPVYAMADAGYVS